MDISKNRFQKMVVIEKCAEKVFISGKGIEVII